VLRPARKSLCIFEISPADFFSKEKAVSVGALNGYAVVCG